MSEMAERVAREIFSIISRWAYATGAEKMTTQDVAMVAARAAIQAMQEPTPAMEHCGAACIDHPNIYMGGPSPRARNLARKVWKAMLDTASPPPTSTPRE